jgi:hypothetical protein
MDPRAAEAIRGMPTVIDVSLSLGLTRVQASHLTPDRLPTLTPSMAANVFATTKENSHWLVSRLGADRGQSSEPVYTERSGRPPAPGRRLLEATNTFELERLMPTVAGSAFPFS